MSSDITRRGRRAFWGFLLSVGVLAGVPSLVLMDAIRDYWRFLTGWDPGVLRPTTVRPLPPRDDRGEDLPDIRFVEFTLESPQAKAVRLAASFNGFDPAALSLSREGKGPWQTLVPLPPGTYEYAFEVDGRWTPDPTAPEGGQRAGKPVSVKVVQ